VEEINKVSGFTVLKAIADNDTNMLYHVVAHELVHARDLLNGNYDAWANWYGEDIAHDIMEHHAFARSIEVEKPTWIIFWCLPLSDEIYCTRRLLRSQ
jgi:hypothetical protein